MPLLHVQDQKPSEFLDKSQPVQPSVIILFLVLHIAFTLAVFHLFLNTEALNDLRRGSAGLLQPTLILNWLAMLLIVLGLFFMIGRLRPVDVGLNIAQLWQAAGITAAIWIIVQLILWTAGAIAGQQLDVRPTPPGIEATYLVGIFLAQLLGNALYEEIAFRGFLLPQFFIRFRKKDSKAPLLRAILASQFIFALVHIPMLLSRGGNHWVSLTWIFAGGIFLALLYIRTENLFLTIGLHTLINAPTPFASTGFPPQSIVVVFILIILWYWPRFSTAKGQQTG